MKNSSYIALFSKKKFLLLLILSFCILIFLFTELQILPAKKQEKTKTLYIKNQLLTVEIADTESLRVKGLSGRKNLAHNTGMLFNFPAAGYYHFWMKEMFFPLDFIWIKGDEIVDLTQNVPIPETVNIPQLPTYTSKVPADKVLEVNNGMISSLKASIGDKVEFK